MAKHRGFTLIELLVVMAVIATLLTIALPRYFQHLDRAREVTLKESLAVMREAIDKYQGDTGRYPETLEELVAKRYLRKLPVDPLTEAADTWVLVPPPDEPGSRRVWDVKSGAEGQGLDGTDYATW
ncbi:prepilin-type N-terminal cleavage/methylation domain-containing protein [Dechloromonas agitata]|uniref:type II secretion system protein n=1 Tax=Dechloromonas agitata TaxID=73030 RepID=UPI00237EBC84|nr:prepilin-type N-terminal cleavage/methylation domain-containing protein [Dechloromonas agitata]MDE1547325.1 prepilin-type N-terminal cleavage/methylation domain-containing protein [Dechloromonas agitata]